MKILTQEKQEIIRLTIKTEKETEYLNIIEATHEDVVKYLQNLFKENTIGKDNKVTVDARYSYNGRNGKSIRSVFYSLSAEKIKEKIINSLK